MTTDDLHAFEEIMQVLNETYGNANTPLSDLKMRFYYDALKDLSVLELNQALMNLAATKTIHTFPTPGEIREAIKGKVEDRAVIAFDELIVAIQSIGAYKSVEFQDGIIGLCVEAMGNWLQCCRWNVDERKWHRLEFERLYRSYAASGREYGPVKVIGEFERTNSLTGQIQKIETLPDHLRQCLETVRVGKTVRPPRLQGNRNHMAVPIEKGDDGNDECGG